MTKQNLKILKHEDKTGQNGKDYTRFQTSNGWMSVFESDIIKQLKDHEGKTVSVETASSEKDGRTFHNIRGFYEVVEGAAALSTQEVKEEFKKITPTSPQNFGRQSVKGSAYEKDPVGLAVEIFNIRGLSMEESIECVKQAQKAFS